MFFYVKENKASVNQCLVNIEEHRTGVAHHLPLRPDSNSIFKMRVAWEALLNRRTHFGCRIFDIR